MNKKGTLIIIVMLLMSLGIYAQQITRFAVIDTGLIFDTFRRDAKAARDYQEKKEKFENQKKILESEIIQLRQKKVSAEADGQEAEVKKYTGDERCGFICTAGFFEDFLRGLKRIHKQKALKGIPAELPVLITSGSEDPVSNGGKTIKTLYSLYKGRGLKDAELKCYEGARHEILNETNKETVKADILNWIEKRLPTTPNQLT